MAAETGLRRRNNGKDKPHHFFPSENNDPYPTCVNLVEFRTLMNIKYLKYVKSGVIVGI